MNDTQHKYGFVISELLRKFDMAGAYFPEGCTHVLVYEGGKIISDKPFEADPRGCESHELWDKLSAMGKYKLDIGVRAAFPAYFK